MRKLRTEQGLSALDITMATRIREQEVSRIETRRHSVYGGYRKKLSDFFGVPEEVLFDEDHFARKVDDE
jgi:transcriptional regulator with XRE-family HTH domain